MRRALRSTTSVLPLLAVAALTACGGGDGGVADIASLGTAADVDTDSGDATATTAVGDGTDTGDTTATTDGDAAERPGDGPGGVVPGVIVMRSTGDADDPELQEAQVEYARCMREHGVDMPDPSPESGETRIEIDDPDAWQEAEEACRSILEEVVGAFEPPSEEEQARMREEALEFARCMREHGVDMPDPQFGENGDVTVNAGGTDGPGGLDPEEFEAAAEECGGPGGGPGVFSSSDGSESD